MSIINSSQCLECPMKTCTGRLLHRLGFAIIKCPFNMKEARKETVRMKIGTVDNILI